MAGVASAWLTKLDRFNTLSRAEADVVEAVERGGDRRAAARSDIVREGDPPRGMILICEGWAFRYKMLADGRRQIVDFLLPGCVCDLRVQLLAARDHSIGTITPVRYAELTPAWLNEVETSSPRVLQALEWETLVNAAIAREWIVNLGQRTALERVAHLMCELFHRLRGIGMAEDNSCIVPLTQMDVAEATGMTAVHVNRTLQQLRARNILAWSGGKLSIPDLGVLESVALFNPDYLHLEKEGQRFDANDRE